MFQLAVLMPEALVNVAFSIISPLGPVTMMVTLPVWFPSNVTVIIFVSFTNPLGMLTVSSPAVPYTSNDVLFSFPRYLSFSRYLAVTL